MIFIELFIHECVTYKLFMVGLGVGALINWMGITC